MLLLEATIDHLDAAGPDYVSDVRKWSRRSLPPADDRVADRAVVVPAGHTSAAKMGGDVCARFQSRVDGQQLRAVRG